MSDKHTCRICGYEWKSLDGATAKQILKASRVNGIGPLCNLCYHLEMAIRYSEARGFKGFYDAVDAWLYKSSIAHAQAKTEGEGTAQTER